MSRLLAFTCAAAFVVGCDHDSPTAPRPPQQPALNLSRATAHFDLLFSAESAGLVDGYAATLEESYARIAADLGQTGMVARITGSFWPDQASFTAATGYQAAGSVDGPRHFHLLAVPYAPQNAVHEYAHNVTLHLAPNAANNPTWLWEAVAVFEAEQFVDPASVRALVERDFPTLAELDQHTTSPSIYEVGYTLAEFIVERWGRGGLRALIVAGGDVQGTFGIARGTFEAGWREFVEERYLGGSAAP